MLSGNNTYSGGTMVASGMLSFANYVSVPGSGLIAAATGGYVGYG